MSTSSQPINQPATITSNKYQKQLLATTTHPIPTSQPSNITKCQQVPNQPTNQPASPATTRASENPNVMETGMPKPGRVNPPPPSPDYAWPRLQRIGQPPWSTPGFCKSANVVPTWRAPTPKCLTQIYVFHIFPRSAPSVEAKVGLWGVTLGLQKQL